GRLHRLLPHVALVAHAAAEGMQLDRSLRLAQAELDAAARQQVERGDALGHADRMAGGQLEDAVTETDATRALGGGAEEELGRGRVRGLLEEVMRDDPGAVVTELVGERDLDDRVAEPLGLPT